MVSDALTVGTEAQAIGQPLARLSELARVRPVEANAEDLADVLAHHLHEKPLRFRQKEGRSLEWRQAVFCADLVRASRFGGRESRCASGSACNTR